MVLLTCLVAHRVFHHLNCAMSSESKPITLADFAASIKDLPDDSIKNVQASIETSLAKLRETNDLLSAEISVTSDDGDLRIYRDAIHDNIETIQKQEARLAAIATELLLRGVATDSAAGGILL